MTDSILRQQWDHQDETLDLLRQLVELESPSEDKALVDRLGSFLSNLYANLGFSVDWFPQDRRGNHFVATRGEGEQVLVIVHFDTVWPAGVLNQRPFQIRSGRGYGPGIYDMKAGIAALTSAVRCLLDLSLFPYARLAVFFSADEELASETSRPILEQLVRQSQIVLCLEPSTSAASVITARKGLGNAQVRVTGVAAHAGQDHEKGTNAIQEGARIALEIQAITDYSTGTTTNVGYFRGGRLINQVPDQAELGVDFRFSSLEEGLRVTDALRALSASLPGAEVSVEAWIDRGPMERTPASLRLFGRARELGRPLGLLLEEAEVQGSTSDANLSSALGVPTLDGLGPPGDGAHASDEFVQVDQIPIRAALIAHLLADPRSLG